MLRSSGSDMNFPDRQASHDGARRIVELDTSALPRGSGGNFRAHDPLMTVYLAEINRYPLLTREQEAVLARRIKDGDQAALDELVKANLRFVVSVAKNYQWRTSDLTLRDLISEGSLGLIKAAQRFDETRGFRFISYAVWWIRQAINTALLDNPDPLRLPGNIHKDRAALQRAWRKITAALTRDPSPEELREELVQEQLEALRSRTLKKEGRTPSSAEYSNLRAELEEYWCDPRITDIIKLLHPTGTVSLQNEGQDENGRSFEEKHPSDWLPPDHEAQTDSLKRLTQLALSFLTPREADVIVKYYGLGDGDSMTLQEIGEKIGLTRERVRQIKEKALAKMRDPRRTTHEDLRSEWDML